MVYARHPTERVAELVVKWDGENRGGVENREGLFGRIWAVAVPHCAVVKFIQFLVTLNKRASIKKGDKWSIVLHKMPHTGSSLVSPGLKRSYISYTLTSQAHSHTHEMPVLLLMQYWCSWPFMTANMLLWWIMSPNWNTLNVGSVWKSKVQC